jgi:hypothetical protein
MMHLVAWLTAYDKKRIEGWRIEDGGIKNSFSFSYSYSFSKQTAASHKLQAASE